MNLEKFYKKYPGSVISTSINKYIYISIHEKFEKGFRIAYSKVEDVNDIEDIEHPIVRNALKILKVKINATNNTERLIIKAYTLLLIHHQWVRSILKLVCPLREVY